MHYAGCPLTETFQFCTTNTGQMKVELVKIEPSPVFMVVSVLRKLAKFKYLNVCTFRLMDFYIPFPIDSVSVKGCPLLQFIYTCTL